MFSQYQLTHPFRINKQRTTHCHSRAQPATHNKCKQMKPKKVALGAFLFRDDKDNFLSISGVTVAVLEGSDFHNDTIEVELKGLASNRTSIVHRVFSRGLVGICFRIGDAVSAYECVYIRSENGVSDGPVRRMHAV